MLYRLAVAAAAAAQHCGEAWPPKQEPVDYVEGFNPSDFERDVIMKKMPIPLSKSKIKPGMTPGHGAPTAPAVLPPPGSKLSEAAELGLVDVVKSFILSDTAGGVDAANPEGFAAIHYAATGGHREVVEVLADLGSANLDLRVAPSRDSALHLASRARHHRVVEALLSRGADPNARNRLQVTPLYDSAQNGSLASVKLLLRAGAIVDGVENGGFTPLHAASWQGHADITELLLEHGADVNYRHKSHQGTALHMATYYGRLQVLRVLLRWGAHVNARMDKGATPIFLAVEKGPVEAARILLQWGADTEIPREDGETVFTAHFDDMISVREVLVTDPFEATKRGEFDYEPRDRKRLAPRSRVPAWAVRLARVGLAAALVLAAADERLRKRLYDEVAARFGERDDDALWAEE